MLITEASFGLFDHHGIQRPTPLAEHYLGIEEEEILYASQEVANQAGRFATTLRSTWPDAQTWQAYHYLTPIRGVDGEAIVTAEEDMVAFRRREGEGTLIYFGTSLGGAIAAGEDGALALLRGLLLSACQPEIRGQHLRVRLIENERAALLIVINPREEPVTEKLTLPARFTMARNIYTDELHSIDEQAFSITLPQHDVAVLFCQK
jgi:hypothetical protein